MSIDFGNDHMYVAGATTVDSFAMHRHAAWNGWTAPPARLAGGGVAANGSTAQVGVVDSRRLLVTLKTDPTRELSMSSALHDGAVTGAVPNAVRLRRRAR